MKSIYTLVGSLYFGLVCGNAAIHGLAASEGSRESKEPHYGDNLRQRWENYSAAHLERLTDPKLLIPFSFFDSPERPLQISIKRTGPDYGIQLKVDVGPEDTECTE